MLVVPASHSKDETTCYLKELARVDNAFHRINSFPADRAFVLLTLNSDSFDVSIAFNLSIFRAAGLSL